MMIGSSAFLERSKISIIMKIFRILGTPSSIKNDSGQ
jgi:hypothetical protein